jgi:hypothetical protein
MRPAQGRKRGGAAFFAQAESISRVGDRVGRVTAVSRVAREDRPVAQVLPVARAIGANTAGRPKPGNADPLANFQAVHTGPSASMRPTISCPGMIGSFGFSNSPSTTWRSVRQTPQASTRTRSSPGPGTGPGNSSKTKGLPVCFVQDHANIAGSPNCRASLRRQCARR